MFGFLHTKKAKRITNATVAGLFVAVQLPLALLWSPTAFAANDKVNDNKPVTGSLTVTEDATPDSITQEFAFTSTAGDPFTLKDSGLGNTNTEKLGQGGKLDIGAYTVTQSDTDGWSAPDISCDSANVVESGSSVTVTLTEDAPDVNCTFANTQEVLETITENSNSNSNSNANENANANSNANENSNANSNTNSNSNSNSNANENANANSNANENSNANSNTNSNLSAVVPPVTHKITICHRTNSVTTPYTSPDVDYNAADGGLIDHGNPTQSDHTHHDGAAFDPTVDPDTAYPTPRNGDQWGDIIPPYTWDTGSYPGKNWNTLGKAIYQNNCEVPEMGTITIIKNAVPITTQSFDFSSFVDFGSGITDTVNFSLVGSLLSSDNSKTLKYVVYGETYTITESAKTGWTLTDISCDGATVSKDVSAGTVSVMLSSSQKDITCTYTNTAEGGRGGDVLGDSTGQVLGASTLANTGSSLLVNLFAGLAIFGSVAALSVATRRRGTPVA